MTNASIDKLKQWHEVRIEEVGEKALLLAADLEFIMHMEGMSPVTKAELVKWIAKLYGLNALLNQIVILSNFYDEDGGVIKRPPGYLGQ